VTEAGLAHPVTRLGVTPDETRKRWQDLPSLAAAASLGSPRAGASILATTAGAAGASRPLIAAQRFGEGRSLVFGGEASWRWRMLLPSSDRSYEAFWRQAVRWLAIGATDPVTLVPPTAGGPGDEVVLAAAVRDRAFMPLHDADVDVQVSGPDGRLHSLTASIDRREGADGSLYVARFTPEGPGVHRVNVTARRGGGALGTTSGSMLVGGADLEMADPRLNLRLLERVAAATAGRVVADGDVPGLVEALRAGAPAAALAVQKDLWHNAWSLVAVIALLAAEWVLRRRWGLR
jgi:hypothetical protein